MRLCSAPCSPSVGTRQPEAHSEDRTRRWMPYHRRQSRRRPARRGCESVAGAEDITQCPYRVPVVESWCSHLRASTPGRAGGCSQGSRVIDLGDDGCCLRQRRHPIWLLRHGLFGRHGHVLKVVDGDALGGKELAADVLDGPSSPSISFPRCND